MPSQQRNPASSTPANDVSALFVIAVAVGPFLLPVLGIDVGDILFAVPAILLGFAALAAAGAARRAPLRRAIWMWLAAAAAAAAVASGIALLSSFANVSLKGAYYVGFAGTTALVVAGAELARLGWPRAKPEQFFDGLLVGSLLLALGLFYVAVPGFDRGDSMLTIVFLADVLAVLLALPAAGSIGWRLGAPLVGMLLSATAGDALAAAGAAGQISASAGATAGFWSIAGCWLTFATMRERGGDASHGSGQEVRWPYARALFPLPVVLAFAAPGVVEIALHGVRLWPTAFFGIWFLIGLGLSFARQAYLVVANRRAAATERRVRAEATRRNEDLEALTGLAATLTESFEEEPILDRGLEVLRLAARATSAALHEPSADGLSLRAITGRWQSESGWAQTPASLDDLTEVEERGGRQIVRLPLIRRDVCLGVVTLIRPEQDRFDEEELSLLRLLVGQLAIALQNVRDYQERLDQAIRDPLTGLYNRRFLHEALEKELQRQRRYRSAVSLVIFDLDDFKRINDRHGHGVGDEVLCRFGEVAEGLIRPMDSLARLGGEEFALLLPETDQLDALLVAERVRAAVARQQLVPGVAVRVSAGISTCPGDGKTVEALHKRADDALYWAKRNGKNICALARETAELETDDEREHAVAHLYSLVEMIDRRLRTSDHSENVANYAAALAKSFGRETEQIVRLRRAALLHDIGKVAVTSDILGKPEPLTPEEYAEIQRHPIVGSVILAHAGLHNEALWIRHHHERIDGFGYPGGLRGNEIPLESRILFVADAFEALTSDRPYRAGVDVDTALDELRRCAGTQFDAEVVERLAELLTRGKVDVVALKDAEAASAA